MRHDYPAHTHQRPWAEVLRRAGSLQAQAGPAWRADELKGSLVVPTMGVGSDGCIPLLSVCLAFW